MTLASDLKQRFWTRDAHFISTDASLIPLDTLQEAFASPVFYWTNPMPDDVLRETIDNSLCFGVYEGHQNGDESSETSKTSPKLVGFARGVTDYTTFLYLTDVWVDPSQQGKGLGRWLIQCVQEVIVDMPYLRRSLLFTGDWERSVPFYEKLMDMKVLGGKPGGGLAVMEWIGRGHPSRQGGLHVN